MKGAHDIRFGFDFVHHLMNHWQPELGEGPRGAFYFDPGRDGAESRSARRRRSVSRATRRRSRTTGTALAAFLLGTPAASGKSSQFIKMNSFENQYALYIRDRWRATPKLTLDLGLRWELYPNRTRSGGLGIESYDPTTNEALIGGRGGIPAGQRRRLQQEAVRAARRLRLPGRQRHGDSQRLRHHLSLASLGRAGAARLVSADGGGGRSRASTASSPSRPSPATSRRAFRTRRSAPTSAFPRSAAPTSARAGFRCRAVAETGLPRGERGAAPRLHPVVEPDRRAPASRRARRDRSATSASASVSGFAFLDINASQIPGSGDEGRPLFAEFGRTTPTREWDGRTHSTYHSLQATLNRRFTDGLLLKAAYTYSKAIDEADYSDWTEFRWNAPSVFDRNRALGDARHSAQLPVRLRLRAAVRRARRSGRPPAPAARSWAAGS